MWERESERERERERDRTKNESVCEIEKIYQIMSSPTKMKSKSNDA